MRNRNSGWYLDLLFSIAGPSDGFHPLQQIIFGRLLLTTNAADMTTNIKYVFSSVKYKMHFQKDKTNTPIPLFGLIKT